MDMNNNPDWGWESFSTIPKLTDPSSNVLRDDDVLTLELKLYVASKQTMKRNDAQDLIGVQADCKKEVVTALKSSLASKDYSDVTLKTGDGGVFYGHEVILAGKFRD